MKRPKFLPTVGGHVSGSGTLQDAPTPPGIRGGHASADVTINNLPMPSTLPARRADGHLCESCGCHRGEGAS